MNPFVFIVGWPRSGTTLLRLLLDAHSNIAVPSEISTIGAAEEASRSDDPKTTFMDALLAMDGWANSKVDEQTMRKALDALDPFSISDAIRVFYQLYAGRFGKTGYMDKNAGNMAVIDLIKQFIPEAKILHIIRDGRDVITSFKETPYYDPSASIDEYAAVWKYDTEFCREMVAKYELPYMEIRYEDLVSNTESVLQDVCKFCEIEFESGMLDYYKNSLSRLSEQTVNTDANGQPIDSAKIQDMQKLLVEPPTTISVGRYSNAFDTTDVQSFEAVAGTYLTDLGYKVG